jgi:cis-3-alkyl-4-acyloxetan-2-one decarboxylase
MTAALRVDGIDVFVDGEGPQTLVMVHGWPDTHRLWDAQVAALRDRWRCVRFTLPGFDGAHPRRAWSLAETVALLRRVVDAVSPDRPVALLVHDWGCVFGYEFERRHPQRVARLIGVDIGDTGSGAHVAELRTRQKLGIVGYQLWLAAAWLIGGVHRGLADRMTRAMARWVRCPADPKWIGAQMNYPYFIRWSGRHGGYRGRAQLDPHCPMLYVYGTRKPFMFHSTAWAEALARRPGCAVLPMNTGHWVMCQAGEAFNAALREWLGAGTASPASHPTSAA